MGPLGVKTLQPNLSKCTYPKNIWEFHTTGGKNRWSRKHIGNDYSDAVQNNPDAGNGHGYTNFPNFPANSNEFCGKNRYHKKGFGKGEGGDNQKDNNRN